MIAGLGETCISVQWGQQKTLYDLAGKRIYRIDLTKSEYVEESLFAEPAFRTAELRNRLMLGAAWTEAKINKTKNPFDRFEVESTLAVEKLGPDAAADAPTIKVETAGNTTVFLHDGQWVVKLTPSKSALAGPAAAAFTRLLAYEARIHPQVRRKIVEAGAVPETLEFRFQNPPQAYTVTWTLRKVAEVEVEDLPLSKELKPAADAGGPLAAILAEVKKGHAPPTRQAAEAYARSALAEKKYLDAMLATIEDQLRSGDPAVEPLMREIGSSAQTDPQLRLFLDGMMASQNPKTAAQALQKFDAIDRTALKKGYVIDIMRANALTALGRRKEARDLFLSVLKANPFIAGAYKDLGELYADAYQMPLAWRCWDAGRQINPNLPLLQDVTKREQWLQENLPDFFLPAKAK
jgi:tetratricopeptide (TPR) repeat protein